eukprot:TRINITY_DN50651_c0_g1_i2.p1 TRINITY_DN50651_c0_g1~~TRINITY_DN50651_c0_g1_i2.p1  ORF type:complete len:178 (-),score=55.53 TRINITY_DN50651_c0_g1_i2:664-1197(-)
MLRVLSIASVFLLLPATPLLSSYKDACLCECCIGLGCNVRLAWYVLSWVFYGFACLWVLSTVLESAEEVGGKVLFGLLQILAMASMLLSRRAYEHSKVVGEMALQPSPSIVGTAIATCGPGAEELQRQIDDLRLKVAALQRWKQEQEALGGAVAATTRPLAATSAVSTGATEMSALL